MLFHNGHSGAERGPLLEVTRDTNKISGSIITEEKGLEGLTGIVAFPDEVWTQLTFVKQPKTNLLSIYFDNV